eukprot:689100-Amphidinium_carterae.1
MLREPVAPCIEDPFDRHHNLGGSLTVASLAHILDKMLESSDASKEPFSKAAVLKVFPEAHSGCFLKFRVNASMQKE